MHCKIFESNFESNCEGLTSFLVMRKNKWRTKKAIRARHHHENMLYKDVDLSSRKEIKVPAETIVTSSYFTGTSFK